MGGRGYSRGGGGRGGGGRGGGRNQQNGGGRAAGASFDPFATTQTSSQSSSNKQSYSGGYSRDRKHDVPFQGRDSGRGHQSHHSRQVTSSSSNIFGYTNDSLDNMVSAAPRQHQHQGFNRNKPAFGHKSQQPFQKQSHFNNNNYTNEMDMEDNSYSSPGVFSSREPASMSIFGQVNAAPSGKGIFGGNGATSSPFGAAHQQHQTKPTLPAQGGISIFGTPFTPQAGSSELSKPAAPVGSGLFGQTPNTQHGSSTLADFKQKQQQQLAQFSQVSVTPQATPQPPPSATNVTSSSASVSNSRFSADCKPVYSHDHFAEYGVPTLPPNTATVF